MSTKSRFIKFVILTLTLTLLIPQISSQETTVNDIQTIQATCDFIFDSQNIYTCNLLDAVIINESDVLEITGSHLDNHTDDDAILVNYYNTTSKYFKGEVLKKFKNLNFLKLMGQGLVEIRQNAFEACPSLKILYIQFNDLTALPAQMLKNCEQLEILKLTHTGLSELPEDLFGTTKALKTFIISNNLLTTLPGKLLENMENLQHFDASSNFLSELSAELFGKNPNLRHVDLSYNYFEDQAKISTLSDHKNISKLSLSFNNFINFDFKFLSQFENLEELTIGSTEGSKLTEISWQSLPISLKSLIVFGVAEDIPENSLDHLKELELLSLTGREIQTLHKDTFKLLTKLEVISIQDTSVELLDPDLFRSQEALSDLNLRNNKIAELPGGIFGRLVNLGIKSEYHGIKMSFNNIQRLNLNSFGQHLYLRYIDFSSNIINEIEEGIFNRFSSNLTYVDFIFNSCIDEMYVYPPNLNEEEKLTTCFVNEIGTTTQQLITEGSEPSTIESTTPGGCIKSFGNFKIILLFFAGLFLKLLI